MEEWLKLQHWTDWRGMVFVSISSTMAHAVALPAQL